MASLAVMVTGVAINALAFCLESFKIVMQKNRKDMTWLWRNFRKQEMSERLYFIHKRLHEQQHPKQTINDLKGLKKYYQVFGRKITPLSPEPKFTDFYQSF